MQYDIDIKKLKKNINYDNFMIDKNNIDKEVNISTMTICCHFENTEIKCHRIAKFIKLGTNYVVACGNNSLIKKKRKPKKNENLNKRPFLNQISLKILVPDKLQNKPVNVKLFKNGSVQMTGCVTLQNSLDALVRVCNILSIKIKKKSLCDNKNLIDSVTKYNICMINSNFDIGFCIDRNRLLKILKDEKLDVMFDSTSHAGVKIKYTIGEVVITLLIFEKGKIIITGVKDFKQLKNAYDFINHLLLKYYSEIFKLSNKIVLQIAKQWI